MAIKVWNGSSWINTKSIRVWNGSSWVPAKTGRVWNGSSWQIFYSADTITLSNLLIVSSNTDGDSASASVTFESDGDIISTTQFDMLDQGDWIAPKTSAPGSYEIRATKLSGDTIVGTLNTWLSLSSNRTWTLSAIGENVIRSAEILIEIRLGSTTLGSCVVTLSAETGLEP